MVPCLHGDLDWPLNASRGLSAIDEFLVTIKYYMLQYCTNFVFEITAFNNIVDMLEVRTLDVDQ